VTRRARLTLAALGLSAIPCAAQTLLPWQEWVYEPSATEMRDQDGLIGLPWQNSGGKEGQLAVSDGPGPWGGRFFDFRVAIDHLDAGPYPMGWPSFELRPDPPIDWSGYDALQYWVRCDGATAKPFTLRFILWTDGEGRVNQPIAGLRRGEWVQVIQRLDEFPHTDRVDRIHFFLCESDYAHDDQLRFQVGGFRLCDIDRSASRLEPEQVAAGLWVGERGDSGDQAVILDPGTKRLPAVLLVETGSQVALRADDELAVRYHSVFSGEERTATLQLGQDVAPGQVVRVTPSLPVSGLAPGYYLVVADIRRGGRSLLGGRVGSDDLYIRRAGESMTYSVLSIRLGMVEWVRDLIFGDIMCSTRIALPHVYDPLDRSTYPEFVRRFAYATGKHTEGNEAGDTGLLLAAEALRKSGDAERCRYAQRLIEDSFRHMVDRMQAPSGATVMWTDELADAGMGAAGSGGSYPFGVYDSNQIGEWMRPLAYGIIYYRNVPGRAPYARHLSAACRRAADYLVAHSTQDSDGLPSVIRHLALAEKEDGSVQQTVYQQEGRQCDVYLGRALSGLSYYAYAMQLLGEPVPDDWWPVLDNTVEWSARKMKDDGWFDWQCEDIVEGGCHTFLGNIYIGEGLFGCYLADKMAGREAAAARAAEATLKAYHYVTDHCYIRGAKYEYPLEFWVGPYVYWLFTEYQDAVGPDARLQDWLTTLDRQWREERGWRDFLDRAPTGGCGRTESNGMLTVSILGYLGLRQMEEIGRPLRWPLEP